MKLEKDQQKIYEVTIDPTPRIKKPSKEDMSNIYHSLNTLTGLTINEMHQIVDQPFGYTWTSGVFSGLPSDQNWIKQSTFGLDFDNKGKNISPDEVIKRLQDHSIVPQIWYETFSSTNDLLKFRVVLFLDNEILDSKTYTIISSGLKKMFPEADPKCFGKSRFFFGGKNSELITQDPINTHHLFSTLSQTLITCDNGRTRSLSTTLKGWSCKIESSEYNFGEKRRYVYNINRINQNSPKTNVIPEGNEQITLDFSKARKKVRIFDEFLKGKWLDYNQLFGLATNLINVKGGRKLMRETMEKYNKLGHTEYTPNNFSILPYLNIANYPPQPIYSFSPFLEDSNLYDLVGEVINQRGRIEILNPSTKISLLEAESRFKTKFEEVLKKENDRKIHILKVPTAIGKTELLTTVTNSTIALPTNSLKNEVVNRMKVPSQLTPDPVHFQNDHINQIIDYYYTVGLPKKAVAVLHDLISGKNSYPVLPDDIDSATAYIEQIQKCSTSDKTIITTHSRAINSEFAHDTVIYDEDPLNELLRVNQVNINDLNGLNLRVKHSELDSLNKKLGEITPGEIHENMPFSEESLDELIGKASSENGYSSNIFGSFSSAFFMKDKIDTSIIHFVSKKDFPTDRKIIILSATVSPFIYRKLFGDRVEVFDLGEVEQMGSVIQYTKRSCSRGSLARYCDQMSEVIGNKKVITFKYFRNQFQNPVQDIYFGNCSGYNGLKGEDLVLVGTPHRNNVEYLMLAKCLGIDFGPDDTKMTQKKIEHNGFKFMFNCYDHEELRKIQLDLIESDLVQAVGRARTLRTEAKVEVYSNFPLKIANEFVY